MITDMFRETRSISTSSVPQGACWQGVPQSVPVLATRGHVGRRGDHGEPVAQHPLVAVVTNQKQRVYSPSLAQRGLRVYPGSESTLFDILESRCSPFPGLPVGSDIMLTPSCIQYLNWYAFAMFIPT